LSNQDISCIVSSCGYWSKGNKCQADHILVTTDAFSAIVKDDVDYEMSKEIAPEKAEGSPDTCCKTYKPRNSSDAPLGGS